MLPMIIEMIDIERSKAFGGLRMQGVCMLETRT